MAGNLPILQPRLLLGLQTKLTGNAQFITDEDVIYPAGSVLTIHNINQKRQKYIRLAEKGKNVTAIVVSPNKKLVAVLESGERPFGTLWDPITYKKKRQITLPVEKEVFATEFVCASFSYDSRMLFCVTGDSDWSLYAFRCDKGRLESSTRANNTNNTGIVKQVACNPNDVNLLVLAGDNLIRIMANTEGSWRQFGYCKADQINFTSVAWLSQDKMLVGTEEGKLLFIENGELKATYNAAELPSIDFKLKEEIKQDSLTSLAKVSVASIDYEELDWHIRCITTFPRGFCFGYLPGTVHLYEMETPSKYIKRNVFKIPDHSLPSEYVDEKVESLITINYICINPAQARLIVTCRESQIYSTQLWVQEANTDAMFTEYGYSLHNGPIGSMATCLWKPILLTAGKCDRKLNIWNYENEELEVTQTFQNDLYACALHPTGLYAVVGFSDKLRFLLIMIDEFVVNREFPIRLCKFCSFSNMGYLFAAANGNIIQVYSSISFKLMYVLKGHNAQICDMSWSFDDKRMVSCGLEGAVYEWMVTDQKRSSEVIMKQCMFRGATITSDGKSILTVSKDGHIREMAASNVQRDIIINETSGLDSISLSRIDQMLFVAGNYGSVYNIRLPLLERAEYVEYTMHAEPIVQMLISYDDRYLLTGAEDGSICFWKLSNTEGRAIKMDKDFMPSKDTLISKSALEERISETRNLQLRLKELETEHAYQVRQNDVVYSMQMKEIHEGYCAAIEELKDKNEQMESIHLNNINDINLSIKKMKDDHDEYVKNMENEYNEKLIYEFEKYLALQEKMEKMRANYENELEDLRKAKKDSETQITNNFLEKLQDKENQLDEAGENLQKITQSHELIKQQLEDDADREIYELKATHAKEIREEQDLNVKIRGEVAMVKKRLIASVKEADDLRTKVITLDNEHSKFKKTILSLEREIIDLKKEVAERDATIQDKEKRIYELKRKNQELEKFKFILDFKIKELKSQIEPRERKIQEQNEQIVAMVKELENLQKVILSLDLQLHELREKLNAADNEVRKEINRNYAMKRALKKIKTEIYLASSYVQNVPLLIKSVKDMYHKFNIDEDFAIGQAEDTEVRSEFLRQREFLESTVSTLQQQVSKSTTTLSYDKIKLTEENSTLLVETNMLRKELKDEQKRKEKLQTILGLNQRYVPPKVALEKVKNATATREEIRQEYRKKMQENERCIHVLKEENDRLYNKITLAMEDIGFRDKE